MVILKADGASLCRLTPIPPWLPALAPPLLGVDHLAALLEVCRQGVVPPSDDSLAAATQELLDQLVDLDLLVPGAIDPPVSTVAAPAPTDPEAVLPNGPLVLDLPIPLGIDAAGFYAVDHDGRVRALLDPAEVVAATAFEKGLEVDEALELHRSTTGDRALTEVQFLGLVHRLVAGGLLGPEDPARTGSINARGDEFRRALRGHVAFRNHANDLHRFHDEASPLTSPPLVKVVPVQVAGNIPPLSTGMVLAFARAHDGGSLAQTYDLHPRWITQVADAPADDRPVVFLFTNYLWSHEQNLDFARDVKRANPHALTIHGGPDCPSYPGDAETYLKDNPQVDVAVRGEGEATCAEILAALAPSMRTGTPDLAALAGVPGVTYRDGDRIVRTADRSRIEDVDSIPSPYLTGVFDAFGETEQMVMAIIETNRGCPYGCTFCDWGSATNSRIRKFDLQRVLDEFTWCAKRKVPKIFVADANFGIFARDVDIARHVVELRQTYGYPQRFITNYAKNTVKHLKEIVSVLAHGGVLTEGLMSLQSMDESTLLAIRRSNIKLDKYEALSKEFRQSRLPLFVDLMMGLPGQTLASLRADLQQCVDREVNAKCHATELLVNSPMNDPSYRVEHRLEISRSPGATGRGAIEAAKAGPAVVVASATFSRDDYLEMDRMRRTYLLAENFGVLRQVTRFVRRELGIGEVELIERLRRDGRADRDRWPYLSLTLDGVPEAMVPPVSWAYFFDELRRYLVTEVGVRPGADLDAILEAQRALAPTPGRAFPHTIDLAHDVAAWHASILAAKDDGHLHDWDRVVDRLATFPPASFTVDDPHDLCRRNLAIGSAIDAYQDWELESPISRAMPAHHQI